MTGASGFQSMQQPTRSAWHRPLKRHHAASAPVWRQAGYCSRPLRERIPCTAQHPLLRGTLSTAVTMKAAGCCSMLLEHQICCNKQHQSKAQASTASHQAGWAPRHHDSSMATTCCRCVRAPPVALPTLLSIPLRPPVKQLPGDIRPAHSGLPEVAHHAAGSPLAAVDQPELGAVLIRVGDHGTSMCTPGLRQVPACREHRPLGLDISYAGTAQHKWAQHDTGMHTGDHVKMHCTGPDWSAICRHSTAESHAA